ncbi:uncharacterized protein BJX67DRAFT_342477 [Aspergillus lucknowensis]|uniref:Uncharacterized protein n=1 Tax=Aspergillus lucknowensis TaxID=176173 RepID=A0ABR4M4J9_9EURO
MKVIASTKQFTLKFSPKLVIPPIALRYLNVRRNDPIRPKIQHMCDNRDRNTLWWRASVKEIHDYKRVVRSWCARRVRTAFRQELKARGFDAEGRSLESNTGGSATPDGIPGNLIGTIHILVEPPCIGEKYATVRQDMKILMDALIDSLVEERQKTQTKQARHHQRLQARYGAGQKPLAKGSR